MQTTRYPGIEVESPDAVASTQALDIYLTPDAVASMLRLSKSTIRRMWTAGLMPHPIRVGRRAIRWRLRDLNEWLEQGTHHAE